MDALLALEKAIEAGSGSRERSVKLRKCSNDPATSSTLALLVLFRGLKQWILESPCSVLSQSAPSSKPLNQKQHGPSATPKP